MGEDRSGPLTPVTGHPGNPYAGGHTPRKRNGGRHRCQPPLSGILPVAARSHHPVPLLLRSAARKTTLATRSGAIRRWFGRPPFGGRPHLESPSSSLLASAETVAVQAMDCISCPDRVRLNSWESRRSVTRVPVHFPVVPARSFPAGLATCLPVPAVRRLRRPMIGSCHESAAAPTKIAAKRPREHRPLWISPVLAISGFAAAFL